MSFIIAGNVAYGKPATQGPNTYGDYDASRAVDGNVNQDLSAGSCAHPLDNTGSPDTAWWEVDLGDEYVIQSVTIYDRTDWQSGEYQ